MEPLTIGTVIFVASLAGIITLGLPPMTTFALVFGLESGFALAVHSDAVEPSIMQTMEEVEATVEIAEIEAIEEIAQK